MHIGRGQFLPTHHKLAPKLAWPGVRDPISKFRDPLNISQTGKATIFKFGMHIGCEQFYAPDQNWPPLSKSNSKLPARKIMTVVLTRDPI